VGFGVLLELPVAWAAARSIEGLLFGVKPGDPVTLAGAILLLLGVSLVAAYLPARRPREWIR